MKNKEERQLNQILDLEAAEIKGFAKKNEIIYSAVQKELYINYPETFENLAQYIVICTEVTLEMIKSRQDRWFKVLKDKILFPEEELALVKYWPEKLKDFEIIGLFPETELAYYRARQRKPDLPKIEFNWYKGLNG